MVGPSWFRDILKTMQRGPCTFIVIGQVAQLVNHRLCNREVAGSNPTACLVVG